MNTSRLIKVEYFLYGWEESYFFEHELRKTDWHYTDGQICLTFTQSAPIFISWFNGVAQYCIEKSRDSFIQWHGMKKHDLSSHDFWWQLINKSIEFSFLDDNHQVLRLFAPNSEADVFLSAQYENGDFLGDCVRVSPHRPALDFQ
jgi:hypothetical protein